MYKYGMQKIYLKMEEFPNSCKLVVFGLEKTANKQENTLVIEYNRMERNKENRIDF